MYVFTVHAHVHVHVHVYGTCTCLCKYNGYIHVYRYMYNHKCTCITLSPLSFYIQGMNTDCYTTKDIDKHDVYEVTYIDYKYDYEIHK